MQRFIYAQCQMPTFPVVYSIFPTLTFLRDEHPPSTQTGTKPKRSCLGLVPVIYVKPITDWKIAFCLPFYRVTGTVTAVLYMPSSAVRVRLFPSPARTMASASP